MTRPSFDPGFSTTELTELYTAESTVAAMLEFEAALALALGEAGVAPPEEAERLAATCRRGVPNAGEIVASTWETGTPLIALREAVSGGEWFHHGATTQDAVDTGQMIQAARALEVLERHLVSVAAALRRLTVDHRDQPQMGRTFLQDARPLTFGFRTATWLDSVLDRIEELRGQRSSLAIQLGGPVGTGDAYGTAGRQVAESLAERLHLVAPPISWHSDRGRILSLAQAVERTARALAKIASDIAMLASSAVAEVSVRSGGSSSMPEKQNPFDSVRAVAAASACTGAVAMLTAAPPVEFDRGVGGWHVEWIALPLAFQTAGAAAEAVDTCLQSLEVDIETMGSGVSQVTASDQIDRVLDRHQRVVDG